MLATDDRQLHPSTGTANLAARCEQSCRAFADRFAFGIRLAGTWWWVPRAELLPMIEGFRGGLANLGVSAGDSVAIAASNRLEWAVVCYAAWGRGATLVPIDTDRPDAESRQMLADSRARVAIGDTAATAALQRLRPDIATLVHLVSLADMPADGVLSFRAVVEAGQRRPAALTASDGGRRAISLYAGGGGTTHRHDRSHGDLIVEADALQQRLALTAEDRVLPVAPWSRHASALHAVLSAGSAVLVDDGDSSAAAILIEAQPTVLCAESPTLAHWEGQLGGAGYLGRRCLAAARRRRAGQPLGWVDQRLLASADRLVPPSRLGPFGGALAASRGGDGAPPRAQLAQSLGVRVYALDRIAAGSNQ